jgi:hypothetical protein
MQRRGCQVPCPPVRLVVQGLGESAVRRGTLRERRGVVDGGPDEGVGELQAGPVHRDQAQLLGRREGARIWSGTVAGCCAQVWAVGHGGQQQRGLRLLGQGGPAAAGGGVVGDHRGQFDQRHGIALCLGEYLRPGSSGGRLRLCVEQAVGVCR